MTWDDTSEDKNRDFPGTIQEKTPKKSILPNSRTRIIVLRTHNRERCAPRAEIGLWRTGEGNEGALLGFGVRLFGGKGPGRARVGAGLFGGRVSGGDWVDVKQFAGGLLG